MFSWSDVNPGQRSVVHRINDFAPLSKANPSKIRVLFRGCWLTRVTGQADRRARIPPAGATATAGRSRPGGMPKRLNGGEKRLPILRIPPRGLEHDVPIGYLFCVARWMVSRKNGRELLLGILSGMRQ